SNTDGTFTGTSNLVINSVIANSGLGSSNVAFVKSGAGLLTVTAPNGYTGGTVVNQGTLALNGDAGVVVIPSSVNGLTLNGATLNMLINGGQIDPGNAVTLNGSSIMNLVGSNSLLSLTFNNNGGTSNPTVNSVGTLALTGATPISVTSSNALTLPTIAGGTLDLGSGTKAFDIGAPTTAGNVYTTINPAFAIASVMTGTASVNKTGNGLLQLSSLSSFSGGLTVSNGGLFVGIANGGVLNSTVTLNGGTTIDLNGLTGIVGGLSGSGTITNSAVAGTAGTLFVGYNNANTVFSGSFSRPRLDFPGMVNLAKMGTGTLNLTGASTSTGTMTINSGTVLYSGAATSQFLQNTVNATGVLTLDNSGINVNSRIGGGSVAATGTGATLTLSGGSFNLNGNAGAPTVESLGNVVTGLSGTTNTNTTVNMANTSGLFVNMVVTGTGIPTGTTISAISANTSITLSAAATTSTTQSLTFASAGLTTLAIGGSTITLSPNAAQSLTFNTGSLSGVAAGASLLLRGTNIGSAAGNGVAQFLALTAAPGTIGGTAVVATPVLKIRPDILIDNSATGSGLSFATYVGVNGPDTTGGPGFRPLADATEYSNFLANNVTSVGTTNNFKLGALLSLGGTIAASQSINSLTLGSGSGFTATGSLPINTILTPTAGGILAFAGNTGLTGGQIAAPTTSLFVWTPGAATNLDINSTINGTGGITKDGAGTATIGVRQAYTGTTNVNGGTLKLATGGGENLLFVNGVGTGSALNVNGSGVFDLNGNSQTITTLASSNTAMAYTGGTVRNSATGPAVNFTSNSGAATFAGVIEGNLNYIRSGNTTTTLLSDNTYTGTTILRGGVLAVAQYGQLSRTSGLLNYFGTLNLDSTNTPAVDINRINALAPITLQGGTLAFLGFNGGNSLQSVGAISLLAGTSTITSTRSTVNTGSNAVLTLASVTQTDPSATVNYSTAGGTLGQTAVGNSQIVITSAPTLVNNLIGGWATVNGTDFASYLAPNTAQGGVGALGSVGYPGYFAATLNSGLSTDNITVGASVSGVTSRTVNSWRLSAASAITLNSPTDTLTIGSGGLLFNGAASVLRGGSLTAGATTNTAATLYAYANNTVTINSNIVNNGTGALTLIKSGTNTLTLTPALAQPVLSVANTSAVTGLVNTAGLVAGQLVLGNGSIPSNTTISAITGATTLTLSAGAAGTNVLAGASLATVFGPVPLTGTTTFGSSTITVPSTNGLTVGSAVSGPGAVVPLAAGATTNGSTTVTVTSTGGLGVGMTVTGPGIPVGATVASVTNANTFVLSVPATATATAQAYSANTIVPTGAVITSIVDATHVTISQSATATGSMPLIFAPLVISSVANGTGTVTVGSNANIVVGQKVTGTGIPAGTTVTAINGLNITLSNNATAGTNDLVYSTTQSNSYTGPTIVNQGTLNLTGLAGSLVIPGDLTINNATVTMNGVAGQIASSANIAINGGGVLNLVGNNTFNGVLSFNNPGGNATPTVAVGFGVLNLGNNITSSNDNFSFIPTISSGSAAGAAATPLTGFVSLGGSVHNITTSGVAPVGLDITAPLQGGGSSGIIKDGSGGLRLTSAGNSYLGVTTLSAGTLFLGASNVIPDVSTFSMVTGSTFDLNGASEAISQLSGGGKITNNSTTASTLTFGLNNASTSFNGNFNYFALASGATTLLDKVNLVKVGTGNLSFTGSGSTIGTLTVNGGSMTYSGAASTAFGTYILNQTGSLVLDNTGTNVNNRLGGLLKNVQLVGGELVIKGNAGADTFESANQLNVSAGLTGIITLQPNAATSTTLNFATVAAIVGLLPENLLLRGTNLGSTPGANVANVFSTTPNLSGGNSLPGFNSMSIRPDIIGDTSITGSGTGFVTYFPGVGFRVLNTSTEMSSLLSNSASNSNLGLSSLETFTTDTVNSLTLNSGGGFTAFNKGSIMTPGNGIVAFASNVGLTGGQINVAGGAFFIHTIGAATTLNVSSTLIGTNGISKGDEGTLSLNTPQLFSGAVSVNAGTLSLNSGAENTIMVVPTATVPTPQALALNGGSVDLKGNNQAFGAIASSNPLPGGGGDITSSTTATLTSTGGGTYGGTIGGSIAFTRSGTTATILTAPQTYSGATIIRGGTLQLRDNASLTSVNPLTNYYGVLNLDNSNFTNYNNTNRLPDATPVTLQGGTLTLTGAPGMTSSESVGTVTLNPGASIITSTLTAASGGTAVLTVANLIRTAGSTVNFTGSNLGQAGSGNTQVFLTQINTGSPTALVTTNNGIIGGWATVNGTDFATYQANGGTQGGVGAMGSLNYPLYSANALTAVTGAGTDNITVGASVSAVPTETINSLRISAVATITQTGGTTLTIASGGLIANGAASVITGGNLTAGAGNELFVHANNTVSITSQLTGASMTLVKSGSNALTLNAPLANTYGATIVDQGTLTLSGAAGIVQVPGNLTINNATVNFGTAAITSGQIATAGNITINGGGSLTYTGNNTTTGTITFNNSGGGANPTLAATGNSVSSATVSGSSTITVAIAGLAVGMVVTGGGIPAGATISSIGTGTVDISSPAIATTSANTLNYGALTFSNTITSTNDNLSFTPTITGGLNLGAAARTITTSGLSPVDLVISGVLYGTGSVVKTGTGSLAMSGAGVYTGGTTLSGGSLIIGATTLQQGVFINGPLGLGALTVDGSVTSSRLIGTGNALYNAITVTGTNTLAIGGVNASNNLLLNGAITFGGTGANTVQVDSPVTVATLGAAYTGSFALTKTGNGILALSNIANTYTGVTTVNGGTIRPGATNGLSRFSEVALAAAGTFDINGTNVVSKSITGTGLVTNNAGASTLSTGFGATNFTFSGLFGSGNQNSANFNLNKIGTGAMTINSNTRIAGGSLTSTALGTLTMSQGTVKLSGAAGTTDFSTYTLLPGGTLTLDNSTANLNDRLGGGAPSHQLSMTGGNFNIIGSASAATTESINTATTGQFSVLNGGSTVTLTADAAQPLTFNVGSIQGLSSGGTMLLRGSNLGGTPGAGTANFFVGGPGAALLPPNFGVIASLTGGGGLDGSTTLSIRADIIADSSITGTGTGFATYSTGGGFRPLTASELGAGLYRSIATNANIGIAASQTFGTQTVNTLTFNGGATLTGIGNTATLNPGSGGILVLPGGGAKGTTGGVLTAGGNQLIIHQTDTVNTFNINSLLTGSNGFIKTGAGAVSLNAQSYITQSSNTTVNAGTLTLNSGVANTLVVLPTATTPGLVSLAANGGILDLNGKDQAIGSLSSVGTLAGTGTTITSTAAAVFTSASAATTFAGVLSGAGLSFTRSGNATDTRLTSDNTYGGATIIRGGSITLRDQGQLSGTNGITLNNGALILDDTGLYTATELTANRTRSAGISSIGGTLSYLGAQSAASVGTFTLAGGSGSGGANTINVTPLGVATNTLTIANLVRDAVTGKGTTVNFTGTTQTNLGQNGVGTPQIILTQINGGSPTSALVNGIIGGWAVVNGTDFASYVAPAGTVGGVGAMGSNGYPNYTATVANGVVPKLLSSGVSTDNINVVAAISGVGAVTVNSLKIGAFTVAQTGATTITIGTGGLLFAGASTLSGGNVTSGGTELFAYTNAAATISSVITGAAGFSLVKSGTSTLTLSGINTYGSGTALTVVDQGTLTLSTANANGTTTVSIPNGTLTINNANVTQTVANTIHQSAAIQINGGSTLTLVTGTNIFNGGISFNSGGGAATPTITGGTVTLGSNISSINDNFSFTPTIASAVDMNNASRTITTSGLSPVDLIISGIISNTGAQALVKAGNGSLVLGGVNTFTGGVNLTAGSIILNNAAGLGTGTLTITDGATLQAGAALTVT
ncbi:MAG: hypothetical protein JWO08_4712, partial [Verrucomicrobiaceae bacterium]|nr:hypothetical protein [Verrucomicrobiaceae bacterium]